MILVRSPLRLTLGGGGTDLPSYANQFGGFTLTAAIDRYVYISVTEPFFPGIYLKYSTHEHVSIPPEIDHAIFRAALLRWPHTQIELTALADIPSGTGLGSSSAFTCALVQALATYAHWPLSPQELITHACDIELGDLQQPIGRQDQCASAYGGVRAWHFNPDQSINAVQQILTPAQLADLEQGLLLFFTGRTREARTMLLDQQRKTLAMDEAMIENLHTCKRQGYETAQALHDDRMDAFADLLNQQWCTKRQRAPHLVPPDIVEAYEHALRHGALGGKLVGAGGGGFLLFYTQQPKRLRAALANFTEVRVRFDHEGTKVLMS
jgi:D-glycero-alpha-D-manno-heptose-7-phosphate kinase